MRSATQKNNGFLESIASSHLVRNASYGKKLIKQIRFFSLFLESHQQKQSSQSAAKGEMRLLQGCVMGMSSQAFIFNLKSVAQDSLVLVEFSQVKKYKRRSVSHRYSGKNTVPDSKAPFLSFFF